jgi:hypothetical protein
VEFLVIFLLLEKLVLSCFFDKSESWLVHGRI